MDCRNPTFVGSEADPEVRLSRFRGWDPKENGALLGALWCALILHGAGDKAPPRQLTAATNSRTIVHGFVAAMPAAPAP